MYSTPEEVRAGLDALIAELARAREIAERWKQSWRQERERGEALLAQLAEQEASVQRLRETILCDTARWQHEASRAPAQVRQAR